MFFNELIAKLFFKLRQIIQRDIFSAIRTNWYRILGMEIGRGSDLPTVRVTWPHQVKIGTGCILENDMYFKFDGPWMDGPRIVIGHHVFLGTNCEFNISEGIEVGDDCLIASGCRFIDHDHGILPEHLIREQSGPKAAIRIESDVWIGANAVVLKGVWILKGAVIGAGSVVTKSVPAGEIWAGVPARRIGSR